MNPGKSTSVHQSKTAAGASQQQQQQPQLGAHVTHGDSEELNRAVVMALARSIHINGLEQQSAQWVKETLSAIMQKTPHSWSLHSIEHFPPVLQEFYKDNPGPREPQKSAVKMKAEEEHRSWTALMAAGNEQEMVQRFSSPSNSFFLCVLWKTLLDSADGVGRPTLPEAYRGVVGKVVGQIL